MQFLMYRILKIQKHQAIPAGLECHSNPNTVRPDERHLSVFILPCFHIFVNLSHINSQSYSLPNEEKLCFCILVSYS